MENMKYIMQRIGANSNFGGPFFRRLSLIQDYPHEHHKHKLTINPKSEVLFRMSVSEEFSNVLNTMHGGAISTLIDITTTIAISGFDKNFRQNVSAELSTYYLNPIKINSHIIVHVKVPKIGKTLAYSHADIYEEENLKLCVNGSHVKVMLERTWKENCI